jgi:hypothetical protein
MGEIGMTARVTRLALVLLAPLMLVGCLLAPGKFTSTLTINADRTFTYSYQGEVYAFDLNEAMKDMPSGGDDDTKTTDGVSLQKIGFDRNGQKNGKGDKNSKDSAKDDAKAQAAADAKNREMAATLSKEAGFRKVTYVGDGKFVIDYQISGKLDHTYLFPYNLDAGIIIPFVAVEIRANGTARVKAPGFANDSKDTSGMGGSDASKASAKLDGTFILDTDAEIVSQNNEEGAKTANGRKTVTWKATPLSTTAPMAVVRFAGVK